MLTYDEIEAALEAAAGAEEAHERPHARNSFARVATAQPTATRRMRRQFLRVLENLPEDATVAEIREAMEADA